MSSSAIAVQDREQAFGFDELFFSTTDKKSIISSGNDVFVRVSGYQNLKNLVGKPHNIIRHPDMPRGVFKLLWSYIDKDKKFAGYVKNRSVDGSYYWVMALVIPTPKGYLSIRFKPATNYFTIVKKVYTQMVEIEQTAGKSPAERQEGMKQSLEHLLAALKENGFENYDDFMRVALAEEMANRRKHLLKEGLLDEVVTSHNTEIKELSELQEMLESCKSVEKHLDKLFSYIDPILDLIKKLEERSSFLFNLSRRVRMISLNGLIASCRLEEGGGALFVVVQELIRTSDESINTIKNINKNIHILTSTLRETAFSIAAAKLQVQMATYFANQLISSANNNSLVTELLDRIYDDKKVLMNSFSNTTQQMLALLPHMKKPIAPITNEQKDLAAILRKYPFVEVSGKAQAALTSQASYFGDIFDSIAKQLEGAWEEMEALSVGITSLKKYLKKIVAVGEMVHIEIDSLEYRHFTSV